MVEDHLRTHRLDESKAAIRKRQMIDKAVELLIPSDEFERLPTEEWRAPTATWLPDGVSSRVDEWPESPVESTAPHPYAED